jgi:hypothetical protein
MKQAPIGSSGVGEWRSRGGGEMLAIKNKSTFGPAISIKDSNN